MSSAEPTRRDFLYIATGAVGRGRRCRDAGAADRADESGCLHHRGRRADRGRSRADRGRPDHQGVLAQQADLHLPRGPRRRSRRRASVTVASLPDPPPDKARVKAGHDQWLVVIGICTHLGCIPLAHQGDYDGWFCPCHGSQYDTCRPHPPRAGAGKSPAAALQLRLRHQDPDRLTAESAHPCKVPP